MIYMCAVGLKIANIKTFGYFIQILNIHQCKIVEFNIHVYYFIMYNKQSTHNERKHSMLHTVRQLIIYTITINYIHRKYKHI